MGLYSLRNADRSVKIAAVLFLLVLGYAYVFAFFMVRHWSGLTPSDVAATYVPSPGIEESALPQQSRSTTQALETLIILGLEWRPAPRDVLIVAAFGFGALDFAGQWLMKAGIGGFAWLTIASGWGMSAVYLILLIATMARVLPARPAPRR